MISSMVFLHQPVNPTESIDKIMVGLFLFDIPYQCVTVTLDRFVHLRDERENIALRDVIQDPGNLIGMMPT